MKPPWHLCVFVMAVLLEAQLLMSELEEKLNSFPAADLSRPSEGGAVRRLEGKQIPELTRTRAASASSSFN